MQEKEADEHLKGGGDINLADLINSLKYNPPPHPPMENEGLGRLMNIKLI